VSRHTELHAKIDEVASERQEMNRQAAEAPPAGV
jgi:hypothetical protein